MLLMYFEQLGVFFIVFISSTWQSRVEKLLPTHFNSDGKVLEIISSRFLTLSSEE